MSEYRAMRKGGGKWVTETPDDLTRWLWANDGEEAVVVDGANYYCGTLALIETYQSKWAAEGKRDDKRRALPFSALPLPLDCPDHTLSAAWCQSQQVLCSERATCNGEC